MVTNGTNVLKKHWKHLAFEKEDVCGGSFVNLGFKTKGACDR